MLTGPIPATEKVLAQGRRSASTDIGVFEVNEAFAPGSAGLAGRDRRRPRPAQPAGRRDRARPPARGLRRGLDDPDGSPHARQRDSVRAADDVRRRRHRQRHTRRACCLTGEFMRRKLFTEDHEAFRELARDFIEQGGRAGLPGVGEGRPDAARRLRADRRDSACIGMAHSRGVRRRRTARLPLQRRAPGGSGAGAGDAVALCAPSST